MQNFRPKQRITKKYGHLKFIYTTPLKILQDETGQAINSWSLMERLIFCEKLHI